jgi:hypothetical protein
MDDVAEAAEIVRIGEILAKVRLKPDLRIARYSPG